MYDITSCQEETSSDGTCRSAAVVIPGSCDKSAVIYGDAQVSRSLILTKDPEFKSQRSVLESSSDLFSGYWFIACIRNWNHWYMSLEEPSRTGFLFRALHSRLFQSTCIFVILANACIAAIVADVDIQTMGQTTLLGFADEVETFFLSFYTLEVAAKLYVHGLYFFANREAGWNMFDLTLVVIGLQDVFVSILWTDSSTSGAKLAFMRIGRLLKMARILRLLRTIRFMSQLRIMLTSIRRSMAMLFWSMLLLVIIWWAVGLVLLQGMSSFLVSNHDIDSITYEEIMLGFGSLRKVMVTLFQISTGGNDWGPVYDAVKRTGLFYEVVFLAYVMFYTYGIFNILTGNLRLPLTSPPPNREPMSTYKTVQYGGCPKL